MKKKCGKWRKWREENGDDNGERKCRGKWRKWREENGCGDEGKKEEETGEKNVVNGESGEKKTAVVMKEKKKVYLEDTDIMALVVIGVDVEVEVLGEDIMLLTLILTLLKKLGLWRRLKRRLTL